MQNIKKMGDQTITYQKKAHLEDEVEAKKRVRGMMRERFKRIAAGGVEE